MMNSTQCIYSEFPPLQGLWTPKPLTECGEILEHLRIRFEVPVGILFLCLTGMRDLESWFAEGISRPQGAFQVVALDQPQAHVNGADLVNAALAFEEGETDIRCWAQLCALALWSELRGAEVSCRWADEALCALRSAVTPEALFFPWVSPAWQHDLVAALRGEYRDDNPYEMALRRGLNPMLIRGLNPGAGPNGTLDAAHFVRARALLHHRDAVARRASSEADFWRLDRYFSPEATGTSLGFAAEIRRFRADLFRWLRDSDRAGDEHLLIAEALLLLREYIPVSTVSCNSFLFRWRTRYPFSYQKFTLGELHEVLSFLDRNPDGVAAGAEPVRRPQTPARRRSLVRTGHGCGVENRHFQVDLHDHRTASGSVFRVPAHTIGQDLRPDIAAVDKPKRLSAIVKEYEEATGRTVIVAINGGYFLDTRTVPRDHPEWLGKPVGFLKCDDRVISGSFYTDRPVLCFDHEHRIALRFVSKGLCSPENAPLGEAYTWSDEAGEYLGVRAAIEAGPLLLRAGKPDLDLEREQWDRVSARAIQAAPVEMSDLRTARTAIATAQNGDTYLVTVHGRVPESVGMTHAELANWLQVEIPEVDWAMEMDAGGSVTAWHVDAGVTTIGSCLGGMERPIASAILFSIRLERQNWQGSRSQW